MTTICVGLKETLLCETVSCATRRNQIGRRIQQKEDTKTQKLLKKKKEADENANANMI